MFRELRKKEKELSREEIDMVMEKAEYGIMSTVGEDGYPYGVPLNFAYKNGNIYFHGDVAGHKLDNLKNNPKVSFTVVENVELLPAEFNTKFMSVIAFGKAVALEGEEKVEGLRALIHKLSKDHIPAGEKYIAAAIAQVSAYKIEVEHLTSKGKR